MAGIAAAQSRAAAELELAKQNSLARIGYNQGRLLQGQERIGQSGERLGDLENNRSTVNDLARARLEQSGDIGNRALDIKQQNADTIENRGSGGSRLDKIINALNGEGSSTNSPAATDASAADALGQGGGLPFTTTNSALNNGSPYFGGGGLPDSAAATALTPAVRTPMINGVPVDNSGNPKGNQLRYNPATGQIEPVNQ